MLVLRSQRRRKCEEIENGEFTVPDVASIEENHSRGRENPTKRSKNTSIVRLFFSAASRRETHHSPRLIEQEQPHKKFAPPRPGSRAPHRIEIRDSYAAPATMKESSKTAVVRSGAAAAPPPRSRATSTPSPRPAPSSTTAARRPANLEQRSRALPRSPRNTTQP